MNNNIKTSEQGQAIVLIALALVALLGFTALAVDGSMVFADRRAVQNAADAAALAGGAAAALSLENDHITTATFNCSLGAISDATTAANNAAANRAATNNYPIDLDSDFDLENSDHGMVEVTCGVDTSGDFEEQYLDIKTVITTDTPTAFAQFIFNGPLRNTVEAVVRIHPRGPLAEGYAIVALNPENCSGQQNGASFHGDATSYVLGGGVFSNGCMRGDGSPIVDADDSGIHYVGDTNGNFTYFDPQPEQVSETIDPEDYAIDPPDCSVLPDFGGINGGGLIQPGNYDQIRVNSGNDYLEMAPGLYCVSGPITMNGGSVTGQGVTIYVTDDVTINGNVEVNLSAPAASPDPSPALAGILFYVPANIDIRMQINGNENSHFVGIIYAPGSSIDLLGNGQTDTYNTQVIGWNVQVGGNADAWIRFDENDLSLNPTRLDLHK